MHPINLYNWYILVKQHIFSFNLKYENNIIIRVIPVVVTFFRMSLLMVIW